MKRYSPATVNTALLTVPDIPVIDRVASPRKVFVLMAGQVVAYHLPGLP